MSLIKTNKTLIYFLSVNYFSSTLIKRLLDSIRNTAPKTIAWKFIIVNNAPDDHQVRNFSAENVIVLDAGGNRGFGSGCNLGIDWVAQQSPEGVIWLINPDTYLCWDSLQNLEIFLAQNPSLPLIGTLIKTPDNKVWFGGGTFSPKRGAIVATDSISNHANYPYVSCDWLSGCSLIINLQQFSSPPHFNPDYFLYYEDFDFCQRYAATGCQVVITSKIVVMHEPSTITDRNLHEKFRHSTYSYLLTLKRYSPPAIFWIRGLRLFIFALILLPLKPQIALGKLRGIYALIVKFFGSSHDKSSDFSLS